MKIEKPLRVVRSYRQRLTGTPEQVFPLLCPVREAEWLEGWDPLLVVSDSGVAEQDCVFITPAGTVGAVWYITRHDPRAGFIEMLKLTCGETACRLTIQLTGSAEGTDADITYAHTSLGPEGDAFIAAFTEEHYARFMQEWETRLNHFLTTGTAFQSGTGA